MKLGTEDMPLSPYQSLTITRQVEELIEEDCFKEIAFVPEPLTLETEILGLGTKVNLSISLELCPPPHPPGWELIS